MISLELEAKILRLSLVEKWRVTTIATQLGIHPNTVERVLHSSGIPKPESPGRSMAEPFIPFIKQTLETYPKLTAIRLFEMVQERGYPGGPDHFRHIVALHRPRPIAEAYLRLKTLPAEQAQVDWGHFGKMSIGRALRPLMAFVMVLSWSRRIFLHFFLGSQMANFLRGHEAAFADFQGVPRVILYDNLKSAVLERQGDAIRFHPTLLEFAKHYHYEPRPVAVARGNEKGRVERAIQYIRHAFFAARQWTELDDLNLQAKNWCEGAASQRRCPEDPTLTVDEAFSDERPKLISLPDNPFFTDERQEVRVGKTPYIRFDLNDYSVPHELVRKTLTVEADPKRVRVLDGLKVVAEHTRSYGKAEQIENPIHIQNLVEQKRNARQHRGLNRLTHTVPNSQKLLEALAERGDNLGSATASLLRLLDSYGAVELEQAIAEAIVKAVPHPHSVRNILERRALEKGKSPPIPVSLPADPRVKDVAVKPHSLDTYDDVPSDNEENNND